MIRQFLSPYVGTALAAAVALILVQPADAQNRGGGRQSGGMPSGGWYGGQPGSYYPGSYYSGGYQPGYAGQYGGYSGGPYQGPGTGYSRPSMYTPYQQNLAPQYGYGQQYQGGAAIGTAPLGNTARLTVRLPADARLWVDDYQSQQTGPVRVLNTPALEPGQKYHYVLKAQWNENGQPVTQERTASFQSGGDAAVDFTQPAPQAAPEPIAPPAAPPTPAVAPTGTPPATPVPPTPPAAPPG